jgi:type II secretory ATPase GspE/PulE/Tfp pilus assembly ATPase PilB-like protein
VREKIGDCLIQAGLITKEDLEEDLDVYQRSTGSRSGNNDEDVPIVDLVDLVVNSAITSRASDVHIEPQERGVLVHHRLDGLLKAVMDLPKCVHDGLVARIKEMAGMDAAEERLSQDGRLRVRREDGRDVDFRVSTIHTLHGEKIVMRIVDQPKRAALLEELRRSAASIAEVRRCLEHLNNALQPARIPPSAPAERGE